MIEKKLNTNFEQTAKTLAEALPYLQRYEGAVVVIKLGGHAMTSKTLLDSFARDIVLIKHCGVHPIIVHGGGPMINSFLSDLKIESKFLNGKRVTDERTMEIVEMVLSGNVNKSIVNAVNKQGGKGVGLSGKDANLIKCEQEDPDLGFVGEPDYINVEVLNALINQKMIPVIAPVGIGKNGETFNINADTAAGAIASAMKATRMIMLTDVVGVLDSKGKLLSDLSLSQAKQLIDNKIVIGGMIPKIKTCINTVEKGAEASVILDGRLPHALLIELFTEHGIGTLIKNK